MVLDFRISRLGELGERRLALPDFGAGGFVAGIEVHEQLLGDFDILRHSGHPQDT